MKSFDNDLESVVLKKGLELVVKHYLNSRDFNGLPASTFCSEPEVSEDTARTIIMALFKNGSIVVQYAGNPHIKAFSNTPTADDQIKAIAESSLDYLCLYPSPSVLKDRVAASQLHDRPYTKMLMLGCGQLDALFFNSEVLERYTANPAFEVFDDGTSGSITTRSAHSSNGIDDYVYLKAFGHGYSKTVVKQHLIVSYPCYLRNLPPKHQMHWCSHQISEGLIDSDFLARSYHGEFTENISVYEAILQQIREINTICEMMNEPPLFKKVFENGVPDSNYGPMRKPTLRAYRGFALSLTKVVLDNVNKDFFKRLLSINETGTNASGEKVEKYKSIPRLLNEWFDVIHYRAADGNVIPSIIDPLKNLNSVRGQEAHAVYKDELDDKWLDEQKKLVTSIYNALDGLRLILSTHPKIKGRYSGPEVLEKVKIKY